MQGLQERAVQGVSSEWGLGTGELRELSSAGPFLQRAREEVFQALWTVKSREVSSASAA